MAIGLPAIAGGVGIGALVDGLHERDSASAVYQRPVDEAAAVRRADDRAIQVGFLPALAKVAACLHAAVWRRQNASMAPESGSTKLTPARYVIIDFASSTVDHATRALNRRSVFSRRASRACFVSAARARAAPAARR